MELIGIVEVIGFIILFVGVVFCMVKYTTPLSIILGEEAFEPERHVKVMPAIDIFLGERLEIDELEGDRDVAWAWGTHPSSGLSKRP